MIIGSDTDTTESNYILLFLTYSNLWGCKGFDGDYEH